MTGYVETAADFAFAQFLASVEPANFSPAEWDLFRYLKLRATG